MKFIRIHDRRTGINYPWMADISSLEGFLEIEQQFLSRDAKSIIDFMQSKDYAKVLRKTFGNTSNICGKDHCHPQNKLYPFLYTTVLTFPEKKSFHPMLYFAEKLSEASKNKIKYLYKEGRILVNENGGFMTWTRDFEEIESMECNRFPQYSIQDIKVSKWPEGKHFYATINDSSIIVNGQEKWNTEKEAMDAAKKWLKS